MPSKYHIRVVNAFVAPEELPKKGAVKINTGNPAGVCILAHGQDFPDDSAMIKIAAEVGHPETSFVKIVRDENMG